jgi:soluble lytic murein transglycosylase-like protein
MDSELPGNPFLKKLADCLFLFGLIVCVSILALNEQHANIPTAKAKKVTIKINPPPSAAKNLAKTQPEYKPMSVFGKKGEHLLHPIILQTANRYKMDPALVNAIIMAESAYNPRAVSKKGARGLMQLMPATAADLGVKDSFNPEQNLDGGVRYFKQLVFRFDGDVKLALAAYNAGSRKVRLYQGVPPFKATKHYIKKVFLYYQIYKDHMAEVLDRA